MTIMPERSVDADPQHPTPPHDDDPPTRSFSRSPHPYRRQPSDLPQDSHRFRLNSSLLLETASPFRLPPTSSSPSQLLSRGSVPASDSGTEADDEHFLKGLPAPKARLHKGLRDHHESLSGVSTPSCSPAPPDPDGPTAINGPLRSRQDFASSKSWSMYRGYRKLARRLIEIAIILALRRIVGSYPPLSSLSDSWPTDLHLLLLLYITVLALYPVRVYVFRPSSPRCTPLQLLTNFDPAPLLYPPVLTKLASLLISAGDPITIRVSSVLAICSIPDWLIPFSAAHPCYDPLHWSISSLPLLWASFLSTVSSSSLRHQSHLSDETVVLIYPLHRTLCTVLHHLTTTSLLPAELQLLSIALISILLLAASPQIQILRSLLWVGGLGILLFCGPVIRRGIALARVPKWRFKRAREPPGQRFWTEGASLWSWRKTKRASSASPRDDVGMCGETTLATEDDILMPPVMRSPGEGGLAAVVADDSAASPTGGPDPSMNDIINRPLVPPLRDSLPQRPDRTHTPSGRRRRAMSASMRPFYKLTLAQATLKKWLYALYVYVSILAVIFLGVRPSIQWRALDGKEPLGWGLGYLFGNLAWFRLKVVTLNLERWICLPRRPDDESVGDGGSAWLQEIRRAQLGEANTRLLISGYWFLVLVIGLAVVSRLKELYEVDTRRKVFHFMMVAMFLPTTFLDPAYAALALALVLALFLLLDLLRASQLPPLSKPMAAFLAPYVDGRDFRGPVVISHIFLLIGCAIPLWLALASLPRTGSGYEAGWEVPTRDVSMVSGVICVGLGDAAASLIGRRFGRRKWFWGGGKSLEGSMAFAVAVLAGLSVASAWLSIGGWPKTEAEPAGLATRARNMAACASIASLTEAVLTGGNDNVIVPVVLWMCVKSLGV